MTIPAAVTAQGLLIPTVEDLQNTLAADQKATVDPLILTDPDSIVGEYNAVFSSHLREAYEAIQVGWDSLDPDNATDARLDAVSSITGTLREVATYSQFGGTNRLLVNLNAGVTLPAGQRCSVLGTPTAIFATTEAVTNSGASPANVAVAAQCTVTGPVHANAGTLTVIASPFTGWNSVTNPGDATLGKDSEIDPPLRIRREEELHSAGTSTQSSLLANILGLVSSSDGFTQPIISAVVLENTRSVPVNGVPAYGAEVVIWDGPSNAASNTDVANVIYKAKGLGTPLSGSTVVTIKDSSGRNVVIPFSRSAQRPTFIEVTLRYVNGIYVGDAAVAQALSDAFQGLTGPAQAVSAVVSFSQYMAVVQALPGVARIELWRMRLDTGALASFVDLTPATREVAVLSTANVTVTSTPL